MYSTIQCSATMKLQQHRSRSEIIAAILESANGNRARITEIQFKTYLSYNLLKDYLKMLLESDLLEYIEGERSFKTTYKGMHYLQVCNRMGELMVAKTLST
jgi:predicted transcriptional regulator